MSSTSPDWRLEAACRGHVETFGTYVPFFSPEDSDTATLRRHGTRAMQICDTCSVSAECLAEALSFPVTEDFGIWGGESQRARVRLR